MLYKSDRVRFPKVVLAIVLMASGSGVAAVARGELIVAASMFGICALIIWVGWFR